MIASRRFSCQPARLLRCDTTNCVNNCVCAWPLDETLLSAAKASVFALAINFARIPKRQHAKQHLHPTRALSCPTSWSPSFRWMATILLGMNCAHAWICRSMRFTMAKGGNPFSHVPSPVWRSSHQLVRLKALVLRAEELAVHCVLRATELVQDGVHLLQEVLSTREMELSAVYWL